MMWPGQGVPQVMACSAPRSYHTDSKSSFTYDVTVQEARQSDNLGSSVPLQDAPKSCFLQCRRKHVCNLAALASD